jgi:hypothetical protein
VLKNLVYLIVLFMSFSSVSASEADEWTELVQKHLGVYSLISERRDPGEAAVLRNQTLFIKFRQDLRTLTASKKDLFLCKAAKWLLAGRLANSDGLDALMQAKPQLKQAKLIVFGVDTSVSPDHRGKYKQTRKLNAQLILTIDRTRLKQLNLEQLKTNLEGENCNRVARTVLTKVWFAEGT